MCSLRPLILLALFGMLAVLVGLAVLAVLALLAVLAVLAAVAVLALTAARIALALFAVSVTASLFFCSRLRAEGARRGAQRPRHYADMNRDRCAKRRARAWRSRASRSLAIQVTGSALGAVRYKAQAYRTAPGGVLVQKYFQKFEKVYGKRPWCCTLQSASL